ncbi:class I SAM-dependent methyltransferase [Fundidesulfovibrio butyratiphilus]
MARLEETFFWGLARNRLVGLTLDRLFPRARTFFEAGCGTGHVLGHLARTRSDLELTGCDLHLEGLAIARQRAPRAELLQADITDLPFREHFDVVAAFDVIEHLDNDAPAVAELARALKPGGGLLLAVPQHGWLWSQWDTFSHHRRRYGRGRLTTLVREAGLTPIWATSFLTLLLPALMAARMVERLPGVKAPTDPLDEMRLAAPLNALFAGVCALERTLIRAKVPMPAGGSLLMAAVKP